MSDPWAGGPPAPKTCYRHPDRRAGVSCQRCDRPICPSCMVQASVGFHCPECVKENAKSAPVYDTRNLPTATTYVTFALIAINVAVFAWDVATGGTLYAGQGTPYHQGVLTAVYVAGGQWYRIITAGFLHYGIIHLAVNMYSLYIIGPQLERLLGGVRFLALYISSLLAGSLGALIVSPEAFGVGASGAIFGLLGAAAAFQVHNKINIWQSGLGNLIVINLLITFFIPFISKGAHVGGLLGGAAVGYAMFELERRHQSKWVGVAIGVVSCVVFAVACVALAPQLIIIR